MNDTKTNAKTIQFARDVPMVANVSVLVIGGGPAGIGAAIGAARAGAQTLLVERNGFLGGMATAGLVGPFMSSFSGDGKRQIVGGVFDELVCRMEAFGGAIHPKHMRGGTAEAGYFPKYHEHVTPFDPEALKIVADEMVSEAGVEVLLHTSFVEPIMEGTRVRGAVVHNKSGLQALAADVVVDCSADADVAFRAGVPTEKGRAVDHMMQPVTLFFRIGNVDDEVLEDWLEVHPEDKCPMFHERVEKARALGEFPFVRDRIGLYRTHEKGVWRSNTTRVRGIDGTEVVDLTRAEMECRKQVVVVMQFLRKYIPGCEHAVLWDTGAQIGVRETRRIVGEYVLTGEDLIKGVHFDDVVALGSFPIDIHDPTGGGGVFVPTASVYEIPYRSIVPKEVEQLLVAGRCLSATHEATGAIRIMPTCFATGHAAGVAAAVCVREEQTPRSIRCADVQSILLEQKAILASSLSSEDARE